MVDRLSRVGAAVAAVVTVAATATVAVVVSSAQATAAPGGRIATGPADPSDTTEPASTDASSAPRDSGATSRFEVDADFQIDLLLGLVPEDEVEAYYAEQNAANQEQIRDCMNEAGFEYLPDTNSFIDPRSGVSPLEWAQQYGFGVWTQMDPNSNPYGDQIYEWPNEEIVNSLSESEQNAWFTANNRCSEDSYGDDDDVYRNPMVQQALEEFYENVNNDPRVRDAENTWRDCMADAGQPFETPEAMNEQVYAVWNGDEELAALETQFYESEAWTEDSPDHERWQQLVDEEIAIAVADAECSPPLYEVQEDVTRDLRSDLVEVWQTIDWDLPPVTYPGEGETEVWVGDGSIAPETPGTTDGSDDSGPKPLDLGGSDDTAPDTTEP